MKYILIVVMLLGITLTASAQLPFRTIQVTGKTYYQRQIDTLHLEVLGLYQLHTNAVNYFSEEIDSLTKIIYSLSEAMVGLSKENDLLKARIEKLEDVKQTRQTRYGTN